MTAGLLSAADIARDREWSYVTAWRYLRRVEKQYGVRLVKQRRTLFIDATDLARIALIEKSRDPVVYERLQYLEDRIEALEARQDGLANDVGAMRRGARG